MRHLILFAITRRSNIRVKWRGWLEEQIRQVMIGLLQMQHILGGQLFIVVLNNKHAHYLLGVVNKVGQSSCWKQVVLIEIKDVASKKLGLQISWTLKINEFQLELWCYYFTVYIKRHRENFVSWVKGYADGSWETLVSVPWSIRTLTNMCSYHIYQPLCSGRIWHKVNFF